MIADFSFPSTENWTYCQLLPHVLSAFYTSGFFNFLSDSFRSSHENLALHLNQPERFYLHLFSSRGHSVSVFILESDFSDLYPRSIDNDGEKDGTSLSYAESSSSKLRRADL